jgi:hypothetical protein
MVLVQQPIDRRSLGSNRERQINPDRSCNGAGCPNTELEKPAAFQERDSLAAHPRYLRHVLLSEARTVPTSTNDRPNSKVLLE